MHAVFWITTLLMTVVALSFVLTPLARKKKRAASAWLAVAFPAFAALAYFAIGSPGVTSDTVHAAAKPRNTSTTVGSVSSLTAGLEARLRDQPDDGEGWLLLAKSYVYLNRQDDARSAYARAVALGETDDTVARDVMDFGDAVLKTN